MIPLLLVDDDVDIREALKEFLEVCGFSVTAVGSAGEALSGRFPEPRVLLTDLSLPDLRGDELARQFHALHPGCLLYLHSGDSTFAPDPTLAACGLTRDHVIAKPSDLHALAARLHRDLRPKS